MSFNKMIPVQLGGKTRNLKYGFNALIDLQDVLGINIQDLMKVMTKGASLRDLRSVLWVGLKHEDPTLTPEAVGDMISGPEDLAALGTAIRSAIEAAFPPVEKKAKPTAKVPGKN